MLRLAWYTGDPGEGKWGRGEERKKKEKRKNEKRGEMEPKSLCTEFEVGEYLD